MEKIEPAYVTPEQAKTLKEMGFDVGVLTCYDNDDLTIVASYSANVFDYKNYNTSSYKTSRPEQGQVVEWFRLTRQLWIQVEYGKDEDKVWFDWYVYSLIKNYDYDILASSKSGFDSPEAAYSAAIDFVLRKINELENMG